MTGQDWLEKDFYAALGVSKDAGSDEIKKAYRKLARQYHPDQNPGNDAAEAKFKEIGEAYSVLSDAEQRKQYDGLRAMAGGGPRFAAGGGGAGAGGFDDLFSQVFSGQGGPNVRAHPGMGGGGFEDILSGMFGGGAPGSGPAGFGSRRAPQRGADVAAQATLPFREAAVGTTVRLETNGRTVTARIPAGVRDGQKIRLRGKGQPGMGGEAGDLVVTVHVEPHPVFSLEGKNLRVTVPITFDEAALGATIDVPTLEGEPVRVKVPAGTPSGRTLRARGKGIKTAAGQSSDLLVTVQVAVPERLSRAAKKAVQDFAEAMGDADPRSGLMEQARI